MKYENNVFFSGYENIKERIEQINVGGWEIVQVTKESVQFSNGISTMYEFFVKRPIDTTPPEESH